MLHNRTLLVCRNKSKKGMGQSHATVRGELRLVQTPMCMCNGQSRNGIIDISNLAEAQAKKLSYGKQPCHAYLVRSA
jgi:hypothetical protein